MPGRSQPASRAVTRGASWLQPFTWGRGDSLRSVSILERKLDECSVTQNVFITHAVSFPLLMFFHKGAKGKGKENSFRINRTYP